MAGSILFFLFFLLPFQFSLGSFGESDVASIRLITPFLICVWAAQALIQKKVILPRPLTLFAWSSFLVWTLFSLTWAENPAWGLRKAIFWLTFFPLFLVLTDVLREPTARLAALRGLVWGGAAVAMIGIVQFSLQFVLPLAQLTSFRLESLRFFLGENFAHVVAQYPSIFVNIGGKTLLRAFAVFPDPHIFSYYVGMLIPLAGYLAFRKESSHTEKILPFILVGGALLSFSRASYVALLGTLVLWLGVLAWKYRKKISVVALFFLVTVGMLVAISPVASRFQSIFSESDNSVTERTRLWHEAVSHVAAAPVWGTGMGNYPLLVKPSALPREPIYVHNLYLDIAVELGIVGLGIFLLFLFSCLPAFSFSASEILSFRQALFLSLCIFLLHSCFEYPLFSVHILPLFLTILALLYVEKIRS